MSADRFRLVIALCAVACTISLVYFATSFRYKPAQVSVDGAGGASLVAGDGMTGKMGLTLLTGEAIVGLPAEWPAEQYATVLSKRAQVEGA